MRLLMHSARMQCTIAPSLQVALERHWAPVMLGAGLLSIMACRYPAVPQGQAFRGYSRPTSSSIIIVVTSPLTVNSHEISWRAIPCLVRSRLTTRMEAPTSSRCSHPFCPAPTAWSCGPVGECLISKGERKQSATSARTIDFAG